jgi:hypothetical protein
VSDGRLRAHWGGFGMISHDIKDTRQSEMELQSQYVTNEDREQTAVIIPIGAFRERDGLLPD